MFSRKEVLALIVLRVPSSTQLNSCAAVVGLLTFFLLVAFPLSPFIIMLWIAVKWTRK